MGLIDFILNVAGLSLWFNWLSPPQGASGPASAAPLARTLRKATPARVRRWMFIAGLLLLLVVRAFFYWQIGAGVNWTPRISLAVITLSFPLSYRGDFFGLMLVYSLFSFLVILASFYLWLLFLSFLGGRSDGNDPVLRLANAHLGIVARWPWWVRLVLPWLGVATAWLALLPVLAGLQLVPPPASWGHRCEQAALLGLGAYLAWKHLIVGLLALHTLNSYVYLGTHAFWSFVTVAARGLLQPLERLPLRTDRVDFTPLVGIALVLLVTRLAESGWQFPGLTLRIPSLAELYMRLPF
jgi:uncharacterized protein YggT (Ycf19 family)